MRPFGSSSWSDVWDRQSGTAGALVNDNAGSRERTSDIPRPQSPPRTLSTQSQNWGGGKYQQFAPPRRQRGTWKPPRGSQYREPRDVRPRTAPRLQASAASLRERYDGQRNRTPPNDRLPFAPQTVSYTHTRGPPPRSGIPPSPRGQPRTPRPLPADHPLMVEMAELKRTRDTRKRYWAGLIPNLGEEWQNPASFDRQQWEEEESLADNKFAELAGQIKMAEMGMSEDVIGYAQDESRVASTASLRETRSRETGKPFRPQLDGGYLKRVPENQRRGGMPRLIQGSYPSRNQSDGRLPHFNQGSYPSRNQSDGRMPHQDMVSYHGRNQSDGRMPRQEMVSYHGRNETENIIPRHYHISRDRRRPTRGRRDHFVNKQPRTWTEQEKDKNVRNWMQGIGLPTAEKRDSLASSWMDESGAPPGFAQESHQRNYMNDISSESDVGGLVPSIEIDKPEYSGPASIESGEVRVEPASRKISVVADDGSKIGDRTRIGELGVRGQIGQTREAAQDDSSSEGSFESFKSLRYSSSDEGVDEQQKAIDDMDFEEAEAERENKRIELGRRMILQQSSGTTPKPNTDIPHTKSTGTTPKPNTDVPHIKLENTSVDITPILKGALPLNRTTNFSHARVSSIAIPAFDRNSHLIVAHSSSNNGAPRSSTLTSSNLATHQTAARNSRPGISSSANFLNLRTLSPSPTQLTESSTSHSPGLDSAAQVSSSDSLRNPTSRPRLTAPNPNALTSSNLQRLEQRGGNVPHHLHQQPLSLGFTTINNQRVEIIDMTAYSVSSTASSDSLSSVPSSPLTTSANPTTTTTTTTTNLNSSPALLDTEDATKFFITARTSKGVDKTFSYKHRDLFDWTSAAAVSKLNKWRSQVLRRTTKQKKRDPKAKYLGAENDFITEAHRAASKAGLRIDWAAVTEAFNERFEGEVIEGSDEPRPARTQKSLVTQRDRIEEVRRIRKTPNARKKEVEAKGKGKAKATAEEVAAWEDEEEEDGDDEDSEYEFEEEEEEDDE